MSNNEHPAPIKRTRDLREELAAAEVEIKRLKQDNRSLKIECQDHAEERVNLLETIAELRQQPSAKLRAAYRAWVEYVDEDGCMVGGSAAAVLLRDAFDAGGFEDPPEPMTMEKADEILVKMWEECAASEDSWKVSFRRIVGRQLDYAYKAGQLLAMSEAEQPEPWDAEEIAQETADNLSKEPYMNGVYRRRILAVLNRRCPPPPSQEEREGFIEKLQGQSASPPEDGSAYFLVGQDEYTPTDGFITIAREGKKLVDLTADAILDYRRVALSQPTPPEPIGAEALAEEIADALLSGNPPGTRISVKRQIKADRRDYGLDKEEDLGGYARGPLVFAIARVLRRHGEPALDDELKVALERALQISREDAITMPVVAYRAIREIASACEDHPLRTVSEVERKAHLRDGATGSRPA